MSKKKPSKIAGAGAGIAKLVNAENKKGVVAKIGPITKKSKLVAKAKTVKIDLLKPTVKMKDAIPKDMQKRLVDYAVEQIDTNSALQAGVPVEVVNELRATQKQLTKLPKSVSKTVKEITVTFSCDAAHRVIGDPTSKCRHLHGHRYGIAVTVRGPLNDLGMVIDFSKVKELVGSWIMQHLDHVTILNKEDPFCQIKRQSVVKIVTPPNKRIEGAEKEISVFSGADLFDNPIIEMDGNPTAENIAQLVMDKAQQILSSLNLVVSQVTVQETEKCSATVRILETHSQGDGDGDDESMEESGQEGDEGEEGEEGESDSDDSESDDSGEDESAEEGDDDGDEPAEDDGDDSEDGGDGSDDEEPADGDDAEEDTPEDDDQAGAKDAPVEEKPVIVAKPKYRTRRI